MTAPEPTTGAAGGADPDADVRRANLAAGRCEDSGLGCRCDDCWTRAAAAVPSPETAPTEGQAAYDSSQGAAGAVEASAGLSTVNRVPSNHRPAAPTEGLAHAWDEGFAAGCAAEWGVTDDEIFPPNPYR